MIHQLRVYEIFEHNKAAFHDRFRDHAARIMRTYGFEIVAMWEVLTERRTEFVYLLAWPNEATKNACENAAWINLIERLAISFGIDTPGHCFAGLIADQAEGERIISLARDESPAFEIGHDHIHW